MANGLLARFENIDNAYQIPANIDVAWGYALTMLRYDYQDGTTRIPNQRTMPTGNGTYFYLGGFNQGLGLGKIYLRTGIHV